MFQWGSIKSGIFESVLLTVPSFIQAYISETSNGMKSAQSILESTLPPHSQIFRHALFQIIFDILLFPKHTKYSLKNVLKHIALSANKIAWQCFIWLHSSWWKPFHERTNDQLLFVENTVQSCLWIQQQVGKKNKCFNG